MKLRSIALALSLLVASACAPVSHRAVTATSRWDTVVEVNNPRVNDAKVFAEYTADPMFEHDARERLPQRVRLGTAAGNSKTAFIVPAGLIYQAPQLRLLTYSAGGSRASLDQEMTVEPGDTVVLTIPPT